MKEFAVYKNIDLLQEGDFQAKGIEIYPDEDGTINRVVFVGTYAPLEESNAYGEAVPALLTVDLEEEIDVRGKTPDEIYEEASPIWDGYMIDPQ